MSQTVPEGAATDAMTVAYATQPGIIHLMAI